MVITTCRAVNKMENKMLISGITVFLFLSIIALIDRGVSSEVNEEEAHGTGSYFYEGDFVLSATPSWWSVYYCAT